MGYKRDVPTIDPDGSVAALRYAVHQGRWKDLGKEHHVRALRDSCKNAKVEPVGFHELRHTYAFLLAQSGVDLLTISKLPGHADPGCREILRTPYG